MWLLVLFIAVPLIEIALFIQVGGWLTLWPTLVIVIGTALLGTMLVKQQGRLALDKLRQSLATFNDPTAPLAHGAMILFSGALLLTPGFLTDAVGFLLLVPAVRVAVMRYVASRVTMSSVVMGQRPENARSTIIEGDYEEADPAAPKRPTHAPSGWTRH